MFFLWQTFRPATAKQSVRLPLLDASDQLSYFESIRAFHDLMMFCISPLNQVLYFSSNDPENSKSAINKRPRMSSRTTSLSISGYDENRIPGDKINLI